MSSPTPEVPSNPPSDAYSDALPAGTRLMWYEIQRVLGRGGFAITYLATDTNLRQPVALKEYLPIGLGQRAADGVQAKPGNEKNFNWGRERFLSEAQTLARFKHPNIVRVVSFFEANNTAYLAMDFEAGQSLASFLATHPSPDLPTLLAIVQPLIDGLEELHRAGFIHRDIKPDNIYLRRDGSPVLLDFGAARQALGGQTQNLTALLSPGYAPLEQYFSEKDKQGPWSDIYALAAVMYRAISGKKPPEATLRSSAVLNGQPDPLTPIVQLGMGRYPHYLLTAIDLGLRLREKERPQSLPQWRAMFEAPTVVAEDLAPLDISLIDFAAGKTAPPSTAPSAAVATRRLSTAPAAAPTCPPRAAPSVSRPASRLSPEKDKPNAKAWLLLAALLATSVIAYKASVRPPPATAVAAPVSPSPVPRPPQPRLPPRPLVAVQQQLDSTMEACKADAEAYCNGIMPGDGRLAACMRDNLYRLAEKCRPLVADRLSGRPPRD